MAGRVKLSSVIFYEKISSKYDLPLHENFYKSICISLVDKIPAEYPIQSILEIGAGTGFSTLVLRNSYPNAEITAIEPSASMIEKAQDKLPGINWCMQNLSQFNSERHFDLIVCSMSGHWLNNKEIDKLFKLAKNSLLAISLPVNLKSNQNYSNGNEEIRKLIWHLKAKPSWLKGNRSFSLFHKKLTQHFNNLSVADFQISENYDYFFDLADSLYTRGVMFALFSEQAEKAKDALSSKDINNGDQKISFDWYFKFIVAGGGEASL